jgi:hypothetical protein
MNKKLARPGLAIAIALLASTVGLAAPVDAHTTRLHDNCTNLNKKWPHGVGTRNAVDKTSGTRVKNFYHNNDAYWRAENHNGDLDRDNDRIACEKL